MTSQPASPAATPPVATTTQTEALIISSLILDEWSETVESYARRAVRECMPAEAYAWRKTHAALRSASLLFRAAMQGDYDFIAKARENGYERSIDDRGPETEHDVINRLGQDLDLFFGGNSAKTLQILQAVVAAQHAGGTTRVFPGQTVSPMNRQQRRAQTRKKR